MRFGLPVSILLHAGILFWALFSVSARVELKPVQEIPIAVELLNISEKTDLRAGDKKAKTEASTAAKKEEKKPEVKEEKKKERVAVLPPKAEEPKQEAKVEDPIADVLKKVEEKKPEPKKEEPKKEAKKEPPRKTEPKKVEKKKEKKKTEDNFDDTVAALLNKVPNPSSASSSNAEADPATTKPKKSIGGENTTGTGLSVEERDMIGAIIRGKIRDERCWNPPVGAAGADQIAVRLKFKLRRDGSVDGVPDVLNGNNSVPFVTAAEAAVRAIINCSPYERLAEQLGDLYDTGWNTVTVNFRPDQMFGG